MNYALGMSEPDAAIIEGLCQRFLLAQEASGLNKTAFAKVVGLNSQKMTNIKNYRNPPSHESIHRAVTEFGFTADWFYFGVRVGFRNPKLADRLRLAEDTLNNPSQKRSRAREKK